MFFANQNSRGKHMDTMKYLVLFAAMKMQKKKNISVILAILNADFKKNHYITICENNHKNEFNSFSEFMAGANKDLFKIF